jgi:hypothetical protein
MSDKDVKLLEAVQEWWSDHEGHPANVSDARLMIALWEHNGDNLDPCPECDGDCGEHCAPTTALNAIGQLRAWIADQHKRSGIKQIELAELPKPTGSDHA